MLSKTYLRACLRADTHRQAGMHRQIGKVPGAWFSLQAVYSIITATGDKSQKISQPANWRTNRRLTHKPSIQPEVIPTEGQ